ncbi:DUF2167 domain-containing protein [Pelagibacteraceae bacterium]|nr:DUF2167 domain-containing protein [Pelagibacteraceae bacterium]
MNKLISFIVLFLVFTLNAYSFELDKRYPLSDEEWIEVYENIDWGNGPTTITHTSADARVKIHENEIYLTNRNLINQWLYYENGIDFGNQIEIYILNLDNFSARTYGNFSKDGYIKIDDWNEIDHTKFIKEKKDLYMSSNDLREQSGADTITDVVWIYKPKLYRDKNIVEYSFKVTWRSKDGEMYNSTDSTVLHLGRYGYSSCTFVVDHRDYQLAKYTFEKIKDDYVFNDTHQYSDFKQGDKVAAYGIGALLAASMGIKGIAKAGFMATLMLFAKKAWFILLLPFIFIGRLFNRKS